MSEKVKEDKKEKVTKVTEENKIVEARATLKYSRISTSKVVVVARLIRGKNVDEALDILKFTNRSSVKILEDLVKSAKANAVNNHYMNESKLYIHEVQVNKGPILKRIIAKSKGSAGRINKRTSHMTVVLRERD